MIYVLFNAIYSDALLSAGLDEFARAPRLRKGLVSMGSPMRFPEQAV
jgi:hypothetical protein